MTELVFRSKVDAWLKVVFVGTAVTAVTGVVVAAVFAGPLAFVAIPLLIVPVGLPVWMLRATYYTLTDSYLAVRCGPFGWRVPLHQVRSVTPTRNPLSSPALSFDRLRIDYGRGSSIMISPQDKELFVRELNARRASKSQPSRSPTQGATSSRSTGRASA
ncbi:MAG TPA: PH domain-containing protein [Gammaproteobacteria bacterium]